MQKPNALGAFCLLSVAVGKNERMPLVSFVSECRI